MVTCYTDEDLTSAARRHTAAMRLWSPLTGPMPLAGDTLAAGPVSSAAVWTLQACRAPARGSRCSASYCRKALRTWVNRSGSSRKVVPASLEDFQLGVRDPLVYRLADLDRRLRVEVPADDQQGGAAKFACPADYTGLPDGVPPSVAGRRWPVAVAGLDDDGETRAWLTKLARSLSRSIFLCVSRLPCPDARDPPADHAPQVRVPGRPAEGHRPVADDGHAAAGRRANENELTPVLFRRLSGSVPGNLAGRNPRRLCPRPRRRAGASLR